MVMGYMAPRTLLVVAPHSDLAIGTDIAAAASGELDTTGGLLTGDVSLARLTDAAQRQQWDMIYFGGHAGEDGWQLSGGEMLDINSMLSVVEIAGARWVFMNACETVWPGYHLMAAGIDAICVFRSPKDVQAGMVARSFFHHLRVSKDPWQAYILSRPRYGEVAYLYLPGRGLVVREKLENIERRLDRIAKDLEALLLLPARIEGLEDRQDNHVRDHGRSRWYENVWLMLVVNVVLMAAFLGAMFLMIRGMG
jgi:hypothetical protein